MITFNDDGVWEQNQDDMAEWFGIVIEDEKNEEPNWEVLTTTNKAIEDFDLEKITENMIFKFECEESLREEFENNLEDFPK